ncbi:Imm26 family immunity protein [Aquimarina latercula]|uniref:Imm26 family immunity protein n=1 Tax=Aquimarina latercula TaxID=987 RepID=UPI0004036FF5|nr:Imm26 family immunity protein [Aquimarina latercula]
MKYFEENSGNLFMIPLFLPNDIKNNRKNYSRNLFDPTKKYGFGRLIEINKSSGDLIEVFNYVGEIPINKKVITESGLMFKPLRSTMGFFKKRWRFVFEDIDYDKEEHSNYSEITFLLGDIDTPILWKGGLKKNIDFYDNKLYSEWIVYPPTEIEDMIREVKGINRN